MIRCKLPCRRCFGYSKDTPTEEGLFRGFAGLRQVKIPSFWKLSLKLDGMDFSNPALMCFQVELLLQRSGDAGSIASVNPLYINIKCVSSLDST